jgi:hypothetical protein
MNWTWELRSRDGGMNGLEFARCTTASGFSRVLVHAAPAQLGLTVVADDDTVVLRADADRDGAYSPITLLELDGDRVRRTEVWPGPELYGLPVLLPGGEVGVLTAWEHADDHSWWRWSVEFSNHRGRPADWAPEGQDLQR